MLSAVRKKELKKLLKVLDVQTNDIELFDIALTHPSFNFETNNQSGKDYERLEFLGDSVVRLVSSNYLYEKYPDFDEGNLTKIRSYIVSDEFFAQVALGFEVNKYLNIGIHEEKTGGRTKESILACAMEAIYGAIYKTNGFECAEKFICNIYDNSDININNILHLYNSKEMLQQYTQSINKDLPEYKIVEECGKDHNKTYTVSVIYRGEELGEGSAKTKKEAEKQAALQALKKLKLIEDYNEK